MNTGDFIALASAIIAVLSFLGAMFFARRSAHFAEEADKITIGQSETALRAAITSTRQSVRQTGLQISGLLQGRKPDELVPAEKSQYETLELTLSESIEDNINAYEDACAKYLDGKIDRVRFKKTFTPEIENICRSADRFHHNKMHPEATSRFQCIWKVYREWFIHE